MIWRDWKKRWVVTVQGKCYGKYGTQQAASHKEDQVISSHEVNCKGIIKKRSKKPTFWASVG